MSLDEGEASAAWTQFFLNEHAVTEFLQSTSEEIVNGVLAAGQGWGGAGWDTTRCARKVRVLKSVALVVPELRAYLNSFLYSLALAAGVGVATFDLSDKAAEVAF